MKQMSLVIAVGIIGLMMPLPAFSVTKVSIEKACAACKEAGVKVVGKGIQSPEKKEASLIGMAYLNYIYQNDISNEHFCQAMLLMNSQVPVGTANPYIHLFAKGMGEKTLPILEDIQLSFDYSIGRSNPPLDKLAASIKRIQSAVQTLLISSNKKNQPSRRRD